MQTGERAKDYAAGTAAEFKVMKATVITYIIHRLELGDIDLPVRSKTPMNSLLVLGTRRKMNCFEFNI